MPTDTKMTEEIERLKAEAERMRYAIQDAVTLLAPQTRVMNPSLLDVRKAVRILQARLPY